jgi:hypothetical protein
MPLNVSFTNHKTLMQPGKSVSWFSPGLDNDVITLKPQSQSPTKIYFYFTSFWTRRWNSLSVQELSGKVTIQWRSGMSIPLTDIASVPVNTLDFVDATVPVKTVFCISVDFAPWEQDQITIAMRRRWDGLWVRWTISKSPVIIHDRIKNQQLLASAIRDREVQEDATLPMENKEASRIAADFIETLQNDRKSASPVARQKSSRKQDRSKDDDYYGGEPAANGGTTGYSGGDNGCFADTSAGVYF